MKRILLYTGLFYATYIVLCCGNTTVKIIAFWSDAEEFFSDTPHPPNSFEDREGREREEWHKKKDGKSTDQPSGYLKFHEGIRVRDSHSSGYTAGYKWRAIESATAHARRKRDRKSTRLNSSHSQISYA